MDMWTTGYLQPILESSQDLTNMEGVIEDGFTTLKFSRLRNTGDNQDVAFTDDKRKNFLDSQNLSLYFYFVKLGVGLLLFENIEKSLRRTPASLNFSELKVEGI